MLKIRQNAEDFRELIKNLRLKPELLQMTSFRCFLLLAGCLAAAPVPAAETFPQPSELQPDVDFWVSIFTRYSTDEGVLHDNRNLGVVYDRLDMPAKLSRRERNRRVDARRKQLQAVLRSLASGKRSNLSDEEARVLALWPADVTDGTLGAAVKRVRFQHGLSDRFKAGLERSGRGVTTSMSNSLRLASPSTSRRCRMSSRRITLRRGRMSARRVSGSSRAARDGDTCAWITS